MPEKWHCFFVKHKESNKYSMKYDFSTYILNKLNEDKQAKVYPSSKEKKVKILSDATEKDIIDFFKKYENSIDIKNGELYFETNEEGKTVNYPFEKSEFNLKDIYNKVQSQRETGVVKSYSKDTFEKLGKTVAYRTALSLCLVQLNNDEFKEAINDVFENDPDNVLLQLKDLLSYINFAAACTVVKQKMNKEEKDSDSYKLSSASKELLEKPETRFEGIEKVKKEITKEFEKYHDIFENAFDEGMKEQKAEMGKPGYKWVDPATGLPPKGIGKNAKKILEQGVSKIFELGNKFADKIKNSPHNLENDIARAAIFGAKLISVGVKGINKLIIAFFKSKNNFKNVTSKTVDKKINEFKPKYEEAKTGNYLPSQITKESDEETKNKCEKFKRDFQSVMYDALIPMYYKQVQVFSECYQNTNDYFILKQTKDGWQTKQTEDGKYTELWNAVLLLKKHIDKCDKFFKSLNLYDEFKNSKMELFLGSIEKNTPNEFQQPILDWFDKINTEETDVEKVDALKRIANIYNEDIMLPSMALNSETFAQYKDKLSKSLQALNVIKEIPIVNDLNIKFKTDDITSKVQGIVPLKKEKTEEVNKEEFKDEFREIYKSLTELETTNKLEVVNDTFKDIDEKANKTINQLHDIVNKMSDEEAKEKLIKLMTNSKTSIDKLLCIKAIMNYFNLTESVSLNEIIQILNEAEESITDIETIKNGIKKIIGGEITVDNVGKLSNEITDKIKKLYDSLDEETKNKLENIKDPLKMLYAISSLKIEQKSDNNEKSEESDEVEKS